MIQYYCKQNKNEKSLTHGKWYAYPKAMSTIDLEGLASHMTEHNTPFSKGTIYGVLCDMVKCIKEQLLAGNLSRNFFLSTVPLIKVVSLSPS